MQDIPLNDYTDPGQKAVGALEPVTVTGDKPPKKPLAAAVESPDQFLTVVK